MCDVQQPVNWTFFFEGDTVDGPKYLSMLQEFFIPEVRKMKNMRSIVFQQDGAPPHFVADVRRFLDKKFSGRWIGRGGPIRWAPRPSDLTPLDFFFMGTSEKRRLSITMRRFG